MLEYKVVAISEIDTLGFDLQHNSGLKTLCFVNKWTDQTGKQWQTMMSTVRITSLHIIFDEQPLKSMEETMVELKISGKIPVLRVSVKGKSPESWAKAFPRLAQHGILVESTVPDIRPPPTHARRLPPRLKPDIDSNMAVGRFTERWETMSSSGVVDLRPVSFTRRSTRNRGIELSFTDQIEKLEVETVRKVWTKRSGFRATRAIGNA